MSSADVNLQLATNWMTTISLFTLIILGLFGCFCNIIIFTSKKLEKNSCAFYFLCTAILESFILCFGGISRLAAEHYGSAFINQNRVMCKIRSYLITAVGTIAIYFVLMAAVDRCMATSVHARHRAFSQMKVAYCVVSIIIIFTMAINVHVLIFFDLQPICIPQPGTYALFYSIYVIVWSGILPDGLILIFTYRTLKNAKNLRVRVVTNATTNTPQQRSKQRTETQLIIMMLAQAFVSVFVDFTRVSCYAFYFLTTSTPKTSYEKVVAVFIFQLSNVLLYLNYANSFYIYTLASSLFRKIFCDKIRYYYQKSRQILCLNAVHPGTVIQPFNNRTSGRDERRTTGIDQQ